jgi:hypothetical protein
MSNENPNHFEGHDGRARVRAALSNSDAPAVLALEDYDRIRAEWGTSFYLNSNGAGRQYVTVGRPAVRRHHDGRGAPMSLARLIAKAQPRDRVTYRDGDTLNLLPENLYLRRKWTRK